MSDVVLADSDRRERDRTAAALRLGGFGVCAARSLVHAGALLRRDHLAGVIVDPADDDPAAVVAELRSRTDLPVIVVSAHAEERDKVVVLDAGADDYLTKPFGADELLARLRAVLRRVVVPDETGDAPIVTPDFTMHLADRRVFRADATEVHLTRVEWRMVDVLAERRGHLVPHDELLVAVWGRHAIEKPGNVRVNLAHIRAKLEPEPSRPRYFLTAFGLGLRFDPTGGEP